LGNTIQFEVDLDDMQSMIEQTLQPTIPKLDLD
jgi:hypothetical protein